jgi:(2Fe-2S) ferredoxin
LAFDPITGELWDTENGPNRYDEINLVLPGFNSGWARIMGPASRDAEGTGDLVHFLGSHYAEPKFSWFTTVGPTALVFLNSVRLGIEYQNDLFVGDINNGNIYRFRMNENGDGFIFTGVGLLDLVADSSSEFHEVLLGAVPGGITDLKVGPDGLLYILSFGSGKILIVSGLPPTSDFDGDASSDIAIYRNGTWFILRSSDGGMTFLSWGGLAQDVAVPGDYDGDGKVDVAVYRDGIWYIRRSSDGGQTVVAWGGLTQDLVVPADYDRDGKTDVAIYRDGTWFIQRSSDGSQMTVSWGGLAQDVAVPGDYDGDGKVDAAVYRDGIWYIRRSSDGGQTVVAWGGLAQDIPVGADYDGDGKTDVAVYRSGIWYIIQSSDGKKTGIAWGGGAEDVPL